MKPLARFTTCAALTAACMSVSTLQVFAADPMTDVCHIRAERVSGYDGSRKGLTWSVGRFDFRLSGTLALGLSHTSGGGTKAVTGPSPAFAGMDSIERREARAKAKYAETYQTCIQGG